jgi:acyl-CoA synthetase (AMP-forming)/AMP-acid ligase II
LFPVQIENILTSNPSVLEAAVVSVPDKKYGEVVGAWIRLRAGAKLSRESVKKIVWESMNLQVRSPGNLVTSARCDFLYRTHRRGFGSSGRMVFQMSFQRRRVERCRNTF